MTQPQPPRLSPGDLIKGHGTKNDFVLVYDPDGSIELTDEQVRAYANRHAGIGADGVIRVVPTRATQFSAAQPDAQWFMDYRNADGSIAEMCGNGVRVFAHFLFENGLTDGTTFGVGTRAGIKTVQVIDDPTGEHEHWYRVDMGTWALPHLTTPQAQRTLTDAHVRTSGLSVERPGLSVDMGNPHTVVALADEAELSGLDLTRTPAVTPTPEHGTNVEYIVIEPNGDPAVGSLRMRVNERGVGETMACGTGACASALAAYTWGGGTSPRTWDVRQPGGTVRIEIADDRVFLSGPAELVARVDLLGG